MYSQDRRLALLQEAPRQCSLAHKDTTSAETRLQALSTQEDSVVTAYKNHKHGRGNNVPLRLKRNERSTIGTESPRSMLESSLRPRASMRRTKTFVPETARSLG